MSTDQLDFKNIPADVAQMIQAFRTEAQKKIEALDASLQEKMNTRAEVEASICLEDAAALIERSINTVLQNRLESIQRQAGLASRLAFHADTVEVSFNSVGGVSTTVRSKRPLSILPYNMEALDVLSLLWGGKEIKAFAKGAALAAGSKPAPEGRSSVEALQLAEALGREIEDISRARKDAVDTLSGFIDVALVPFIQRAAPSEPPTPSPEPSVKVQGADGVMRPYMVNDSYTEFWKG